MATGLTGLCNLGNTCFLNSCIQVLNHTPELTTFLDSNAYARHLKSNLPEHVVLEEWKALRVMMWQQNGVVSPNRFVHRVHELAMKKGRQLFTGWAQNDLPEFLLFLVECMHSSISRQVAMRIHGHVEHPVDRLAMECYAMLQETYKSEYSEIMDMFYGIYVSELSGLDGAMKSRKPESFFILDLEVHSKGPADNDVSLYRTLQECIQSFTQVEVLEGDNAWFNECTQQKESVNKRITFWNFPTILVITLKRFHDGSKKLQHLVDFPLTELDLSQYVVGYHPSRYVYDLIGICNHSGNTMGGHYTAYVLHRETDTWTHFNDTSVEHIPSSKLVTAKAYCLFYRRKMN